MLKFNNVWLFVKNIAVILSMGRWPIWGEVWRTSKAGVPFSRLAFEIQSAFNHAPKIIRETIDDCQLSICASGTLGMGYQVMVGNPECDPNVRAAIYRVLSDIRIFHPSVDSMGLLLLEGCINERQYLNNYLVADQRDRQFKQTIVSKYPKLSKSKDGVTPLQQHVKRILDGEDREMIFDEYVASIWSSTKGYRSRISA